MNARGPKRIFNPQVVDENGYDIFPHELTVDENGYDIFPHELTVDENGYA